MNEPIRLGVYRHKKGAHYTVVGIARDSENGVNEGRHIVVYTNELGQLCTRPRQQFDELVEWPDGQTRPRFTHIRDL